MGNTRTLEIWKAAPTMTGQLLFKFYFLKEQEIYLKIYHFMIVVSISQHIRRKNEE